MVFIYGTKFVCFFISFSIISACKNKRYFSIIWKKCRIFWQDGLWKISSWSILWNTQEDQTCISWIIVGLSLRNKVCLFLHSLLYHICMQEQEKTFPFHEKNTISLCGRDFEKCRLGQHMVFLYRTKCVCFFISFSLISACKNKRKLSRAMKKIPYLFARRTLKNLS